MAAMAVSDGSERWRRAMAAMAAHSVAPRRVGMLTPGLGGSSKGIYCPQADRDHMWRCVHPPHEPEYRPFDTEPTHVGLVSNSKPPNQKTYICILGIHTIVHTYIYRYIVLKSPKRFFVALADISINC